MRAIGNPRRSSQPIFNRNLNKMTDYEIKKWNELKIIEKQVAKLLPFREKEKGIPEIKPITIIIK